MIVQKKSLFKIRMTFLLKDAQQKDRLAELAFLQYGLQISWELARTTYVQVASMQQAPCHGNTNNIGI